jgi:hypothetical protein
VHHTTASCSGMNEAANACQQLFISVMQSNGYTRSLDVPAVSVRNAPLGTGTVLTIALPPELLVKVVGIMLCCLKSDMTECLGSTTDKYFRKAGELG